jgi:hypothetical protein
MKPVVFLGPSLPVSKARQVLDADYRPPAKRGDLFEASKDARLICLIDGVFFQDCSVAHKEIVNALRKGVRIVGASSMGALRASETDVYGMEGVGEIYRMYRDSELVADDEVALIFDPVSFEPLSEPLVNIRHNLQAAMECGYISKEAGVRLLEAARALYFPDRCYERILHDASAVITAEDRDDFERFLRIDRRDLKADDAVLALRRALEIEMEMQIQQK